MQRPSTSSPSDNDRHFSHVQPRKPLTKQVNQLVYENPNSKYVTPWSSAPEFLKVFSDTSATLGANAVFDCVLLGTPRPRVCWLFNDRKLVFDNCEVKDTADECRLNISNVEQRNFGYYTVVAENEIGRATATAALVPK